MMIIKKTVVCIVFLLALATPVLSTSYTYSEFNDSTSSKNLTFTGGDNQTAYFNLPLNANITSGQITLTGIMSWCYQESANTVSCGQSSAGAYESSTEFNDGDWDNYATGSSLISNWSKPENATQAKYQTKMNYGISDTITYNATLPDECFNQDVIILNVSYSSFDVKTSYYCWNGSAFGNGTALSPFADYGNNYDMYEEAMWWNISSNFPYNAYLETGTADGTYDWNYTDLFNTSEITTLNTTSLQAYLNSCTPDSNGNCTIPLVIHSDNNATMLVSNIQLNVTDVFVWANTTPTSRIVSMPYNYQDSFTITVTNKGYFAKSFVFGCVGAICSSFSITTTLSNNQTDALDYDESASFTVIINPHDDEVSAGLSYTGNLTINGSGVINIIPLQYLLGSAAAGGTGGGGGGTTFIEILPDCPEGYEQSRNPINGTWECIASPVPLREAETFLLEYPVIFGLSLWTIILGIITTYMIYSFTVTRQYIYIVGACFIAFLWLLTMPTYLYTALDNILNNATLVIQ